MFRLFVLYVTAAALAFTFIQGIFFSIVLLISYIGKVWIFVGFIGLVCCFIFASTNYNN